MSDCIFCKIIAGEIPGTFVHKDDVAVIFLDLNQSARGHLLIVPRQHVEQWHELPNDIAAHIGRLASEWAPAMLDAVNAEGYNVTINNGKAANQEIPHVHLHLLPRRAGDRQLRYTDSPRIAEPDELHDTAAAIRDAASRDKE